MVKNADVVRDDMPPLRAAGELASWVGVLLVVVSAMFGGCAMNDRDSHIQGLVQDLRNAPLGFTSLGAASPVKSETTDELISYGDEAVPYLVDALASDNPVQVGYAAYCLREIGASKGISAAESAVHRLQASQTQTPEVRFALSNLEAFLSSAKGG